MNNSETIQNDPVEMTVKEYAKHFNMEEATVRTRINRKKLKTIKKIVDDRETVIILVERSKLSAVNNAELLEDDSEVFESLPVNNSGIFQEGIQIFQEQLTQQFEELQSLRDENRLLRQDNKALQADKAQLQEEIMNVRVQHAQLQGRLEKIQEMERTIQTIQETVNSQKETIAAEKTAYEALNHERVVITKQLQKYRDRPDIPPVITVQEKQPEKKPFIKIGPWEIG